MYVAIRNNAAARSNLKSLRPEFILRNIFMQHRPKDSLKNG